MNVPKLRFKEFNDEWIETKIQNVATVIGGGTPSTDEPKYWGNEINWFTPSEIGKTKYVTISNRKISQDGLKNSSAKLLPKGTILLSSRATVGEASILLNEASTNQGFQSLIVNENNCNEFIYYLKYKYKREMLIKSFGSTFLEISKSNVENIKIKIPSKEEQFMIANFLSLLDKKIELQTKKIEDLKLFKLYIRNKIFSGIKTKDKIINTLNYEQPNRYIVKSDDYLNDENLIPVLTANKAFILGYCNEDDYYNKGDVIIFDDFTMDSKYVNFNFKIKSSAIKLLTQKNNNNLKYIFECLQALNLESTEHKRHYISIIQEIEIPVPDIIVQNKIANLMFMYDKKIKLESDNYSKLIELKKGLMQNMFV